MTSSTSPILQAVAERQAAWSATAGKLKARADRARTVVLALGVIGAVLETAAGTLLAEGAKAAAAWTGACCLALIPVISSRFLGRAKLELWTRARSASESFKSEAFKFRAGAAPYEDPETAESTLHEAMSRIDVAMNDIRHETANVDYRAKAWSARLTVAEFIEQRLLEQACSFYRPRASRYKARSDRFRAVEFGLALVAAALGAAAGAGLHVQVDDQPLELAAWVAVVTTVSGAFATHAMAARYDRLVGTYLATANRLETLALRVQRTSMAVPSPAWSAFVHECEEAISTENESWKTIWAEKLA